MNDQFDWKGLGDTLIVLGPYIATLFTVLIAYASWRTLRPRYKIRAFLDREKRVIRILVQNVGKSRCQIRTVHAFGADADVMTPILDDVKCNIKLDGTEYVEPQATLEILLCRDALFPEDVLVRIRTGRKEKTLSPKKIDVGIPCESGGLVSMQADQQSGR